MKAEENLYKKEWGKSEINWIKTQPNESEFVEYLDLPDCDLFFRNILKDSRKIIGNVIRQHLTTHESILMDSIKETNSKKVISGFITKSISQKFWARKFLYG